MIRIAAIPLASTLTLLGAISVAGQTAAQATVDIRFGATDGTVAAGRLDEFDQIPRRSFSVGASVTLPLRQHFGLRFGAALTGKGTTYRLGGLALGACAAEARRT